jgi:hypothetical protein
LRCECVLKESPCKPSLLYLEAFRAFPHDLARVLLMKWIDLGWAMSVFQMRHETADPVNIVPLWAGCSTQEQRLVVMTSDYLSYES